MSRVKYDYNAIFFVVYIFMFAILRVLWEDNEANSSVILGSLAVGLILMSFIFTNKIFNQAFLRAVFLLIILLVFFLLNSIFRSDINEIFYLRIYEFVIYGIIPILLFSNVRSFRTVILTYFYLSILLFILFGLDPFYNYKFSNSYMEYGYQIMMPVFFGFHIGRVVFNYRWLLIFQIIAFLLIVIFGNRMASISCLIFMLLIDLFYKRSYSKKYFHYFILFFVLILFSFIWQDIIIFMANILEEYGLSSYSLRTIVSFTDLSSFSAGRDVIWGNAIDMINRKPLFGYGIGAFENIYGTYSHNFILEIILSFGIIGSLFFIILLLNSVLQIFKSESYLRLIGILLFCTSFPKLLTSIYIFKEPTFWLLIFYGIFAPIYNKKHIRNDVFGEKLK